jgi:hypothetical protein
MRTLSLAFAVCLAAVASACGASATSVDAAISRRPVRSTGRGPRRLRRVRRRPAPCCPGGLCAARATSAPAPACAPGGPLRTRRRREPAGRLLSFLPSGSPAAMPARRRRGRADYAECGGGLHHPAPARRLQPRLVCSCAGVCTWWAVFPQDAAPPPRRMLPRSTPRPPRPLNQLSARAARRPPPGVRRRRGVARAAAFAGGPGVMTSSTSSRVAPHPRRVAACDHEGPSRTLACRAARGGPA